MTEWKSKDYDEKYSKWKKMWDRYDNYKPMWDKIIRWIKDYELIGDFGCGAGLTAKYLIEKEKNYYFGIDFSEKAIKLAKKNNPKYKDKFIVGDLYSLIYTHDYFYDVALFLDVLEHLEDDIKVISSVPKNKKVIMALPTFWSPDHVRVFPDKESCERYKKYIKIEEIDKWKNIWIVKGVRK